jgi:TRAP-type transport system small permease protein
MERFTFFKANNMKNIVKVLDSTAVFVLILLTGIVLLQVILRNFFGTGLVWVEEFSRFLLVTLVLISAPVVFYHDKHVKFDMLVRKSSAGFSKIHSLITALLVIFFYVVYLVSHLKLMKNSGGVISPSLSIPNRLFFGSALIGAVTAAVFGIVKIIRIIRKKNR